MVFCTNCGTQVADGVKFCTSCGTPIAATAPSAEQPPVTPPQAAQQPPVAASPPIQRPTVAPPPPPVYTAPSAATVYQEEPISTGSYIGILLLLLIPIVNLICVIIWACGGSRKRNKTNLARALLVWMLIGTVLACLVFFVGSLLFGDQIEALKEFGSQISGEIVE